MTCYSSHMKILAIETSCDETGICILENKDNSEIQILGNALASQVELHAKYGGVFPAMAKRAHAEKFVSLLIEALEQANMLILNESDLSDQEIGKIKNLTIKESGLTDSIIEFFVKYKKPDLDYIAVTTGPGLEPALWVGINGAKVLSTIWNTPIIPINHMEGHIITAALGKIEEKIYKIGDLNSPALSLLVSGGHTELVLTDAFGTYKKIGQTRDDAVGEAFDKVARMLGLPYPGGPAISKLAQKYRESHLEVPSWGELPRPMLHSGDYDFSFSGIKTAVLYAIRDHGELSEEDKMALASSFEDAVVEVLIKKTIAAAEEYHTQTIIVGGGVASNTYLRSQLKQKVEDKLSGTTLLFPEPWLATDNAIMIGMAAMWQIISDNINAQDSELIKADGNLSINSAK